MPKLARRAAAAPAAVLLWSVPFLAGAPPALAHGFGQRYDLPVPLWLYLYGAAGAVLLSFVVLGLFVGGRGAGRGYPRLNLLRFGLFRATLAGRAFVSGLRVLSVALFGLVIFTGLVGNQTPVLNLAPTVVWVIFWVGFSLFVALVGNLWALANPLKVLFEWADGLARRLGVDGGLASDAPYPAAWGVWPALALFFIFVWVELVFPGSATPRNIAFFVLLYSSVTWAGMSLFGKEAWLRNGEAFSVFFGILARFAPTEVRVAGGVACKGCDACGPGGEDCVNCYGCFARAAPGERELNLRPPAVGLLRPGGTSAGMLAFVVFMLAGVTYDGLLATPLWLSAMFLLQSVTGSFGVPGTLLYGTLGLVAVPLLFLGLYAGFVKLCQAMGGGGFRGLAGAFAYSLVPIALAYQAAHYFTLLITEGQNLFALVSDPFGWGWDLFGTAGYEVDVNVVGAASVWYSQVALIVAGHVVAVYLAHAVALREVADPRLALRGQIPMVALMVLYTVASLWILSQPVVE
ncbi:MAG: Serine phosphatase RsbU, regulator of sigma subunit [uncultured Rubrobacteraceae bacterium]|uniref:Serine phosphatase RsbU, regulator of sigma subunit n=1 Tax=uncultured Rubrobacteraceae bacterium TaxID=349277 RepID=A0A6J4S7A6_9ACTN|nr:MAG: Serine phosphatase RsbU, regulator of sigma subunit [uncultured Rubrobacteraceae bacterium]